MNFKVAAGFGHYLPNVTPSIAGVELAIGVEDTVADLLDTAGFPGDVSVIIFINGKLANKRSPLRAGDTIFLAQTIAGG